MENVAVSQATSGSIHHVSDTAFWVAYYRAKETARTDALVDDPLAARLIGDRGPAIAKAMAPEGRYTEWTLVMRTRIIDAFVESLVAEGFRTVVNLGAGLDTRPYRLALPPDLHWVEIDFPDFVRWKENALAGERPHCRLERLGVDLENGETRRGAFEALSKRVGPAVVITEGVLPYLTEALAAELATDLHRYPSFQRWIAEYYSPKLYPRFRSEKFRRKMGGAPFRFFPEDAFGLFERCGWKPERREWLFDEGERTGRRFPLPGWLRGVIRTLAGPRRFEAAMRLQAYVVFRRT